LMQTGNGQDTTGHVQTYTYKSDLQLDVYSPVKAEKAMPAIILFHGGSWVTGKKDQMAWQCKYFAEQGMVAITADYRLLDKDTTRKDICIMDARSAVRWVKTHGKELHIDTNRIVLGGASAGGHLATMVALGTAFSDPIDDQQIGTRAIALVLFNPAYSLSEKASLEPYALIDQPVPPTILFFGSRDKWKPAADNYYALLKQKKTVTEMWVAGGEVHGFFNKAPWNLSTCIKAQEFLLQQKIIKTIPTQQPTAALDRQQ
jgi:acetyl esterase